MVWDRRGIALTAAGAAAAVAVTVTGVVVATRGSPAGHLASAPTPAPSPSASHREPLRSPFTGMRVHRLNRVLVVKIGNTFPERPATGLARADIVYLIPVEGGLSRIMAVFSSHYPRVIGPVRSARETDRDLLRQFGRPAFAWSGAQPRLQWVVQHSWRIVDLYAGTAGGYFRSFDRPEPYNLYANTRTLLKEARHASLARDVGFRFAPRRPVATTSGLGRCPTRPRRSGSPGHPAGGAGWCGWTALRPSVPAPGRCPRPPW